MIRHLVLAGGGHAHVSVLKSLAMRPVAGLRISLITSEIMTPYSGMLPGYLQGCYPASALTIDLSQLASSAAARLIEGKITNLDADRKQLIISGRPAMRYDLLSLNIGAAPALNRIEGAADHAIAIKPVSSLMSRLDPLLAAPPASLNIIGGGAAGVEVALALAARFGNTGHPCQIRLLHRGSRLLPEANPRASAIASRCLHQAGVACHLQTAVRRITATGAMAVDGSFYEATANLLVTAAETPGWLQNSGLALHDDGRVAVNSHLQSLSHEAVFAAGDCASVSMEPRPRAGVFAVRAGKPLARNLHRHLLRRPLTRWRPQRRYLALLGDGKSGAIAIWGPLAFHGRLWWRLKQAIDIAFIRRFNTMPAMPENSPSALARLYRNENADDPALAAMRCLGCGAKTGWSTLDAALSDARSYLQQQGGSLPGADNSILGDAALMKPPAGEMVQSVDAISAITDDPFLLGRIAACHALSDLHAAHARPYAGLAVLTLPPAVAAGQRDEVTQLLAGAMQALAADGAFLAGGHTSEGPALQIGFAVTGFIDPAAPPLTEPADDSLLLLTKPLGSGVIMAAHARGIADGRTRQHALAMMAKGNGTAAGILAGFGRFPMTDVTGFGLARHARSLLGRIGDGSASATLWLPALPLLPGAASFAAAGVASMLAASNAAAAPLDGDAAADPVSALLHDPQTGGGLLAIVPSEKAASCLEALTKAGVEAALIGRYHADGLGALRIVSSTGEA